MTPISASTVHPQPEPTVLRARTPEDLLAVVPVVLGFTPSHSVVMLTFAGRHQFHARVDLPDLATDVGELADVLLDPAVRHGVPQVVLLVYCDDGPLADAAWRALERGCADRRIEVMDALRVEEDRWFPLVGRDAAMRELGVGFNVSVHRFAAQAVLDGRVTHRSRAALAATLAPLVEQRSAVVDLVVELAPRPEATDVSTAAILEEGTWVEALVERHLEAGTSPTAAEVARLVVSMRLVRVRDAAWARLDRPRARAAVALLTDVLRRTPTEHVPAVASLLAWSAWQAGDGALAWCAIDRCIEVDPDYSLMRLLADGLTQAVPPSAVDVGFDWRAGLR